MNKFLSISYIIILAASLNAQTPEWLIFNKMNSPLPDNQVHIIAIDNNNTKWIGTTNGLARFDGTNWQIFNTLNSNIPSNEIYTLEIVDDEIWAGTSNGLAKFNGAEWTVYNNSELIFASPVIIEIVKDKQNNYWVASDLNIVKFQGKTWNVEKSLDAIGVIQAVAVDSIGQIWVGDFDFDTHNGVLWKYDGMHTNYFPMRKYPDLISSFPNEITFDENNILWMAFGGTVGGGIVKIENETWIIFKSKNSGFPNGGASAIKINNDKIFIGTSAGLVSFHNDEWKVFNKLNSPLPDDWVYSITIDRYGNKWLATIGGGVVVYNEDGISDTNGETENLPAEFYLSQNYPNPFNPVTTINFSLSESQNVKLKVYNFLGQEVTTLLNGFMEAGEHSVNFDATNLVSGLYFYKFELKSYSKVMKMIFLK